MPAPEYVCMLNNGCQKAKKTIVYAEQNEGPKNDENWTLTAFVDQIQHGQGTGKTKDSAKAAAAKMALEALGWLRDGSLTAMMPAPEYVCMLNNGCQKAKKTIVYAEQNEGPKNDENWTLTAFVDQIQHGQGTGKTKDSAKAAAAKMTLESLGWL